ncbi:MAG: hypothetical protein U1F10_11700 [Burkholderiales bacterium]
MKLSLQVTTVFALVFALACFGVAINGFLSLGEVEDAAQRADAQGFAWFWALLGAIGVAVAVAGHWLARRDAGAGGARE